MYGLMIIVFTVSLLSSAVGAICGIGGGVIIKPVLDATGIMSVSAISFLSGCTVLSMSVVSVFKNLKAGTNNLSIKTSTLLAFGAVIGGVAGKLGFQTMKESAGNEALIGMVQAAILLAITVGTLIYTILKTRVKTRQYKSKRVLVSVGLILGIMSSFLGIGGGPMNLIALEYFFSMRTKEAAFNSLYIIMFSQIASLIQVFLTGTMPEISIVYGLLMVGGGILGGNIGSVVNKRFDEKAVNKLFIVLLMVIIGINVYNIIRFSSI
ncbi:TSUP family transporter [Lacrimispora sp.]|uniref:TSUP family transporter n=1 Tax=Lacrimispora sp. TaxID=2719234 RepID=UPI0034607F07